MNELNVHLMSAEDVVRWYKPQNEIEQLLVDHIRGLLENGTDEVADLKGRIDDLEDELESSEQLHRNDLNEFHKKSDNFLFSVNKEMRELNKLIPVLDKIRENVQTIEAYKESYESFVKSFS